MDLIRALVSCCSLFALAQASPIFNFHAPPDAGLLQNVGSRNMCLTLGGVSGTRLSLAPCDLVSYRQLIDFEQFSSYERVPWVIRFHGNSKVVQVTGAGRRDGDPLDLGPFDYSNPAFNQKWGVVNGAWDDTFSLKVQHSEKCLTTNGSALIQSECKPPSPGNGQTWRVIQWPRAARPYSYLLRSVAWPTYCLDNYRRRLENGAPMGFYRCSAWAPNHHWYLEEVGNGTELLIRNLASQKCVHVLRESRAEGANVTQWTCPTIGPLEPPPKKHFLWVAKTPDAPSPTARLSFENVNAAGKCLREIIGRSSADISTCVPANAIGTTTTATGQLWHLVSPAQYLLPAGSRCTGGLECLSWSCSGPTGGPMTCRKGGIGAPCQTKKDCESGNCADGNCIDSDGV